MTIDIVVLAPGFLGFDHFGGFPYFGQTVGTAIRVALEEQRGDRPLTLKLLPATTNPTGSLEDRQLELLNQLKKALPSDGEDVRLHIVGHSTGGLDAELLLRATPLFTDAWRPEDLRVRAAIRSVVTVCAPLNGSGIADSALGRFLATGKEPTLASVREWLRSGASVNGLKEVVAVLGDALGLVGRDMVVGQLLTGARYDLHPTAKFLASVLLDRRLLADLRPEAVKFRLNERPLDPTLRVKRSRVLTIARNSDKPTRAGQLFENLYRATAESAQDDDPELMPIAAGIKARLQQITVINATGDLPPITPAASDGIVNTLRQLLPGAQELEAELGRIAALVVADHIDVIGYFPGASETKEYSVNGFLESGSAFRDAQFSKLYRLIAREIGKAIP
jgi:pimeloyl-ACP methyl ester carboxylesterase